jgi:hypothetical protein
LIKMSSLLKAKLSLNKVSIGIPAIFLNQLWVSAV